MAVLRDSATAPEIHSRTNLPAAALASALTPVISPEMASGPDYYLLQTGNEFLELWHAEQGAWLQAEMHFNSAIRDRKNLDDAVRSHQPTVHAQMLEKRLQHLAGRIEKMEASTVAGLCVKALAIAWFHSDTGPNLTADDQTPAMRLAQSILLDLIRLVGEQPAGERLEQIKRLVEASQAAAEARQFIGRLS